jgi:biopolymer transport protein ExbB
LKATTCLLGLVIALAPLGLTLAADADATTTTTSPPGAAAADDSPSLLGGAWTWFARGGPIMYPIAFTSLIGLAFIIERAVAIRHKTAIPEASKQELTQYLDRREVATAIDFCNEQASPFARVVKAALLRAGRGVREMERAAEDAGTHELWLLRRNVRPIGIVASISPLLGLLGTVLGLIGAFMTMSRTPDVNPSAFAGDIYQALLTTFFGLTVAIPMVVCYHWLHGKAEAVLSEIEETVTDMLLRMHDEDTPDRDDPAGPADEEAD